MLIRQALKAAGYAAEEATPEALKECFLDYVDSGAWRDLDLDEAAAAIENGTITIVQMCRALIGF